MPEVQPTEESNSPDQGWLGLLFEETQKTFKYFKEVNDRAEEEKKKLGGELGETKEHLSKLQEKLNELGDEVKAVQTAANRPPAGGEEQQVKAARRKQAFLNACRKGIGEVKAEDREVIAEYSKALSLNDDTASGYLAAPPEYVREIVKDVVEFSPVREIARVRQTDRTSIQVPRRTGTFSAQWVAEQGTKSETTGYTTGLEEITAHEMYALVDISEQMLEDSAFDMDAELRMEFSEQFGVAEGTAFVTGNGVGRPEGFTVSGSNSVGAVTASNSTANTLDDADDLIVLFHEPKTAYLRNAVWGMSRATLEEVRKLKDGQGQYLLQLPRGISESPSGTILGRPVVEMTDMPSVATGNNAVVFGDFRQAYTIVDRIQIRVLRDEVTQATSGNVRFIARKRVGGQVVKPEAIKLLTIG